MVSLAVWAYLAEAAFVGCIFVVLGEEAQCPPIGEDLNRWKFLPQSDAIHDLTNGLHVQLRRFRRRRPIANSTLFKPADFPHFKFVGSLYPRLEDCETSLLAEAVRKARLEYPYTGAAVQTTLCVTNKRRKIINAIQNRKLAPSEAITCKYEGEDPRAQDMLLWAGLALQAAATERQYGLKNALRHTVETVDAQYCKLTREDGGDPLTVPTPDVAKLFRLSHALTIDSSQARTLYGNLLITELIFSLAIIVQLLSSKHGR